MNRKYNIKLIITFIILMIIFITGITYAYFTTIIGGNENASEVSINTALTMLRYSEDPVILSSGEEFLPGRYLTHNFYVENIGAGKVETYYVYFWDVINNFENQQDLVFEITCKSVNSLTGDEIGTCSGSNERQMPNENKRVLVGSPIDIGITHKYSIKIIFKETGVIQNENMGKLLAFKVLVAEGSSNALALLDASFQPNGSITSVLGQSSTVVTVNGASVLKYKWSNTTTDASDGTVFQNGDILTNTNTDGKYYLCIYAEDASGSVTNMCSKPFLNHRFEVIGGNIEGKPKNEDNLLWDLSAGEFTIIPDNGYSLNETKLYCSNNTYDINNSMLKINESIISNNSNCTLALTREIDYSGNYQTLIAETAGYYNVEAWGAQGGQTLGGKGGYTKGTIYLNKDDKLYVYVGQKLDTGSSTSFNGGTGSIPGGGATDIRYFGAGYTPTETELIWDNITGLRSRIMTAGGGGAGTMSLGGSGGGLDGLAAGTGAATNGKGGTQTAGGVLGTNYTDGSFGIGGNGCGGGGGYYGGGGGGCASTANNGGGGGGGSSFISGYAGVNAITSAASTTHTNNTIHYSGKYFINTSMIAGNEIMPSSSGGTEAGHTGNGYAKITYLGNKSPEKIHTKLDNVRYIKSCSNGNDLSYAPTNNYIAEVQATKNGINVAYNKAVTSNVTIASGSYDSVTDGLLTTYAYNNGNQCTTVDLGDTYDLDEIMIYHLPIISQGNQPDGNSIKGLNVSVSSDNTNWVSFINTAETAYTKTKTIGFRYSAWETILDSSINPTTLYTYTGNSIFMDDGSGNWRIKFLTSGTLTLKSSVTIDAFLVGGGGGGGNYDGGSGLGAGGGGGGYTKTVKAIDGKAETSYSIVIGSGGARATSIAVGGTGGTTSAFSNTATGGGGGRNTTTGGAGGSGGGSAVGLGGVDGASGGTYLTYVAGTGQGTTTREFAEPTGTSYASGGPGYPYYATVPIANTGGGGAGGFNYQNPTYLGTNGAAGIVIIRNAR